MDRRAVEELCGRKKDQRLKLIEIGELTRQIADAASRRDNMVTELLLSERERPILDLLELQEGIEAYLEQRSEAEAIRLHELLRGAEPEQEEERPLATEVADFRRALENVIRQDRELSVRMGGRHSFYTIYDK